MQSSGVVEMVDVVGDGPCGLASRFELDAMNEFLLQGCEEAFADGVVPTVAFAAHADDELLVLQVSSVLVARVLASSVRMVDQIGGWVPKRNSLLHRTEGQARLEGVAHLKADHFA